MFYLHVIKYAYPQKLNIFYFMFFWHDDPITFILHALDTTQINQNAASSRLTVAS